MLTVYLQQLLKERDDLTRAADQIAATATDAGRDLSEPERANLADMSKRCAVLDDAIETYNASAEKSRKYAKIRAQAMAGEAEAEAVRDNNHHPTSTTTLEPRHASAEVMEDRSWAAPFMRSGVLENYTGRGTTSKIEIGPAFEARGGTPTGGPITTETPPDGVIRPMRWTGNATPTWAPRLLSLVNTVPVSTGAVDWVRFQPHPPSPAQVVPEGQPKPEAEISLEIESAMLQTYAHWKAITRQALEDIPQIQAEIENRLRAGILFALQDAVANAINNEGDFPTATGADMLAAIRVGIGEMDDRNGYVPNGVLLSPADWAAIDLQVLAQTQNINFNSNPWGLTFAASRAVPEGTAYVGDFRAALTLFQRNATSVYLTDSHEGYFVSNILVILAETRAYAAVTEPLAMVKVTAGGNGAGGASGQSAGRAAPRKSTADQSGQ